VGREGKGQGQGQGQGGAAGTVPQDGGIIRVGKGEGIRRQRPVGDVLQAEGF
jgi:hypothetical protein